MKEQLSFSKIRALFWPIHGYELKKFLPIIPHYYQFIYNKLCGKDYGDESTLTDHKKNMH